MSRQPLRRLRRAGIALRWLVAGSLAGCGASTPTHYHTLVAAEPAPSTATAQSAGFLIELLPVAVPEQVDQPQLVVRGSEAEMLVLEHERWIAPLADELRTALSGDLTRELSTQDIAGQPRPPGMRVVRIKVDFRRFDSEPARYAGVEAVWSLRGTDDNANALVCTTRERAAIAAGYDELVRGHQRVLAALASRVAVAARRYVADPKAACPPA